MQQVKQKMSESLFLEVASKASAVDDAVRACEQFVRSRRVADPSSVTIVLRELLANAIVHGNHNFVDLPVHCTIEDLGQGEFNLTVEDRGKGFDHQTLDTRPPADPRHVKNRGYVLIYGLAAEVAFNDEGNRVTARVVASAAN